MGTWAIINNVLILAQYAHPDCALLFCCFSPFWQKIVNCDLLADFVQTIMFTVLYLRLTDHLQDWGIFDTLFSLSGNLMSSDNLIGFLMHLNLCYSLMTGNVLKIQIGISPPQRSSFAQQEADIFGLNCTGYLYKRYVNRLRWKFKICKPSQAWYVLFKLQSATVTGTVTITCR
jgi:hypothetical protein